MQSSEVITVERGRAWFLEQKPAIVVESYELGAVVSHVAVRRCIRPAQVFAWRKLARAGALFAAPPGPTLTPEPAPMAPDMLARLLRLCCVTGFACAPPMRRMYADWPHSYGRLKHDDPEPAAAPERRPHLARRRPYRYVQGL